MLIKVIALLLLSFFVAAHEDLGELSTLIQPDSMALGEKGLYITDGAIIRLYSLPDLHLQKEWGKNGDGPGEFRVDRSMDMVLSLHPLPKGIIVCSSQKFIVYDEQFKIIRELHFPFMATQVEPVQNEWLVSKFVRTDSGMGYDLVRYNAEQKGEKKITSTSLAYEMGTIDVVAPVWKIWSWQEKSIVAKGMEQIEILVFDKNSQLIQSKALSEPGLAVDDGVKKELLSWLKGRGWYSSIPAQYRVKHQFPSRLPLIVDGQVYMDCLYLQTQQKKDNLSRFLVLHLISNEVLEIYLPVKNTSLMTHSPYAFYQGYFYSLYENAEQNWKLFRYKLPESDKIKQ